MTPTRLRAGELLAALGALALLVALSLRPYTGSGSGWGSVGWLALVPMVVAIGLALALVAATAAERTPALPLALAVLLVPWALLATVAVVIRLLAEPGVDADVGVRWPAYLGLLGALATLVGAWVTLADERTGSKASRAQTERALAVRGTPREVPPSRNGGA
jgi:hypothetical protein